MMRISILGGRVRFIWLLITCSGIFSARPIDAATSPQIFPFRESSSQVEQLTFSPDGRSVVAASEGAVAVWELSAGRKSKSFGEAREGFKINLLSPDAKFALLGEHLKLKLWDVSTGKPIRTFMGLPGHPDAAAFSPDSRFVLFAGRGVSGRYPLWLWDAVTGMPRKTFQGDTHSDHINCVAFSPDRRYALTGSRDYTLKLWDVASGKEVMILEGHTTYIEAVAFSPDGRYALSRGGDNRLWDVSTGKETKGLQAKENRPIQMDLMTFSQDGRYVFSASKHTHDLTLWDFTTKKEIASIGTGQPIGSIALSPDGRLALTGHKGNKINIWDVEAFKRVGEVREKFKAEDRDMTYADIKLEENLTAAALLATFISFDDGEWVVMTPEGYFNSSPQGSKHIKVRVGGSVLAINNFFERFYNPGLIVQKLSGKGAVLTQDIRRSFSSPPSVRIISPQGGESYEEETITITVGATDTGGGIDEIRLYHNDTAVSGSHRGVKIIPAGNRLEKIYQVALLPGENVFRAVGFSKDRTESDPHEIKVRHTGTPRKAELHLVTIGINNYQNPSLQLNFAVADAQGLRDFFGKKWPALFSKLNTIEVYDKQATKANIQKLLAELKAREQDVVIIYLAGHGTSIADEWYFICHDVTHPEREDQVQTKGISSTEMARMIMNIPALKKALLIDSCKSGGFLQALSRGVEDRRAIAQLARATGTHVIAASTDKQLSSEISQLGHGVFTYALLQGLRGKAENRERIVTVRGLIAYLEGELPGISEKYRNIPQYPVVDSRGQDFPLAVNR